MIRLKNVQLTNLVFDRIKTMCSVKTPYDTDLHYLLCLYSSNLTYSMTHIDQTIILIDTINYNNTFYILIISL